MDEIYIKSLEYAKKIFSNEDINNMEIENVKGLQQIHKYLFNFTNIIRKENISKDNLRFANPLYLEDILKK